MKKRALRAQLWELQKGLCFYCSLPMNPYGALPNRASLDHIIPRVKGGLNSADNFVMACTACNSRRGHMGMWTFIFNLRSQAIVVGKKKKKKRKNKNPVSGIPPGATYRGEVKQNDTAGT